VGIAPSSLPGWQNYEREPDLLVNPGVAILVAAFLAVFRQFLV
jgi:hypothetical protein